MTDEKKAGLEPVPGFEPGSEAGLKAGSVVGSEAGSAPEWEGNEPGKWTPFKGPYHWVPHVGMPDEVSGEGVLKSLLIRRRGVLRVVEEF